MAASVVLGGVSGAATYYIQSRLESKGIVSVSCLDRMAFADADFPAVEFVGDPDNIPISNVMGFILQAIGGLTGWGGIPSWLDSYPRSKLSGVTCSDILSQIAAACCGIWYITESNSLQFLPYGVMSGERTVTYHTAVDPGIEYAAAAVYCTDGSGNVFTRGDTLRKYDTITISSDLIIDQGCQEIYNRASNFTYKAMSCERCILSDIPQIGCDITFAGSGKYRVNNISCSISAAGIYATLGANSPTDSEIGLRGKLTREISGKVAYNKKTGINIITEYQGVVEAIEA